jgi:hypothetical protein
MVQESRADLLGQVVRENNTQSEPTYSRRAQKVYYTNRKREFGTNLIMIKKGPKIRRDR